MSVPSREDEIAVARETYEKEVQLVSNCCGSKMDLDICRKCKEHTEAEPIIDFEDWLNEQL